MGRQHGDPLGWSHDVAEVAQQGIAAEIAADAAACGRVAAALELLTCNGLVARYRIRPIAGGGFRLAGNLVADVVQQCIITLEPVPAHLETPFDVEYWPPGAGSDGDTSEEISALGAAEIEVLDDGRIDVGRIVFEQLAAALDPYPRKQGAELGEVAAGGGEDSRDNPFAVLKQLKGDT